MKIEGVENTGVPPKKVAKPSPIVKRQTFLENSKPRNPNKDRKKSVILEIPVINILKAHSEDEDAKSSKNLYKPNKYVIVNINL